MLAWPHSGLHLHDAVLVRDDAIALALYPARYDARNPVALDHPEFDAPAYRVRYQSFKLDGTIAGTATVVPLEFLARHGAQPEQASSDDALLRLVLQPRVRSAAAARRACGRTYYSRTRCRSRCGTRAGAAPSRCDRSS